MEPIESTSIGATGYDHGSKTLGISFKGGNTYHYHNVPESAHLGLIGAKSAGSYFNKHIAGKYRFTKQ